MGRLQGNRALMTGAGGLMGAELARAFAHEGADLVLTTRTEAKLAPLAAAIRGLGVRVATAAADFTRDEDVDRLARTSLGRVGVSRECLGLAIYLASDESSFTRGQCIAVDGGRF